MNTTFLNDNSVIFANNLRVLNVKSKSDEPEIDEEEEKKWIDFDEAGAGDEASDSEESEEVGESVGAEESLEDEDFNEEE